MSEFGKLLGLCQNCLRHNPTGVANCLLAKDAAFLANKWKHYNLMVTDCALFAPPKVEAPQRSVKEGNPVHRERKSKKVVENDSDVAVNAVIVDNRKGKGEEK